ncbi:tagaturonate reductase [Shivajiella indica]|uniref:Tagaturonate reductase n=1 Tax=Shivajiella indica TaxID=872115 RepID=A0ABW5B835_9BACT
MNQASMNTIYKIQRPIKVLQFGTGNFLRGFADWMIDIMNESIDFDGNVHVVQVHGKTVPEEFIQQNYNYHVLIRGIMNEKVIEENRLITCISGITNANVDYRSYLELAKLPDLQCIISNTTEAGIVFDPLDNSGIDKTAVTFPGKLTAFLFHRFQFFKGAHEKGLTILPCELIEKNGEELKSCILKYAKLWELSEDFMKWIEISNTFCNTLVDRIVPGLPKDNFEEIQKKLGFEDQLMVMAEPYHLWVIEGSEDLERKFPACQAGIQVKFVKDLSPYRTRKVRILNGSHTAMVPLAYLSGLRTVRESVEDHNMGKIIHVIIFEEIIPTLDLPKAELEQFASDVLDRFRNPFIQHELISISLNSISKFKARVLPSLLEYKNRQGIWSKYLTRSLAALIYFYSGKNQGENIPLKDEIKVLDFFGKVWKENDLYHVVNQTLQRSDFWGVDLSKMEGLSAILIRELENYQYGVR